MQKNKYELLLSILNLREIAIYNLTMVEFYLNKTKTNDVNFTLILFRVI
jgi:hypothetical protein